MQLIRENLDFKLYIYENFRKFNMQILQIDPRGFPEVTRSTHKVKNDRHFCHTQIFRNKLSFIRVIPVSGMCIDHTVGNSRDFVSRRRIPV